MFDIGVLEVAVILVLALLVLGPERLPVVARKIGYWIGKGRRYLESVKQEVEKEIDSAELKRILHNQSIQIEELQSKINKGTDEITSEVNNAFDSADAQRSESQYEILEEDDGMEGEIKKPSDETSEKSQ